MADRLKMCCAIDYSEASRLAVKQASELARRMAADLTLVHVLEPVPAAVATVLVRGECPDDGAERQAERTLEAWREQAESLLLRPVTATLLAGDVAAEIVRHAEREKFDLLVVASHGRTGLRRLVLGSVAEKVARLAPCPVLITRRLEGAELEADADEVRQYQAGGV
jgi:universal stress protein A